LALEGLKIEDAPKLLIDYTEDDEYYIFFDWNGKHGSAFADSNVAFRRAVLAAVIAEPDRACILLVRDLFRAETQYSREAWSIDLRVRTLAEMLLIRGGVVYVEDYLEGKAQGFDAWCATSHFAHTPELGTKMLAEVERRLASSPDEQRRKLLEMGREAFASWTQPSGKQ